jgi:hypothetical protein
MTSTPQTQDSSPPTRPTDLRELFPALHLLRASGLAIDPRKMFLGGLALLLIAAADWGFRSLPFAPGHDGVSEPTSFVSHHPIGELFNTPRIDARYFWRDVSFSFLGSFVELGEAIFMLTAPIRILVENCWVIFSANQSWSSLAFAWTQLLWALIVWSFFGGALCRMNALQFAARRRIGIGAAFRFSRRQLLAFLIGPLLPLSAVLILRGICWLLGLLASGIPEIGTLVLGIGWVFVLFCGFLMAMLLLGLAFGWPLMIAAISTEDSDGFDGLSRAFGYLYDRPWNAAFLSMLSVLIFTLMRPLVLLLIILTISVGAQAVEQGFENGVPSWQFTEQSVVSGETAARDLSIFLGHSRPAEWPEGIGNFAVFGWTCIPVLLLLGFGPSFFWSTTTVSYFLLRQSDDGTPLDAVVDWPEKVASEAPAESEKKTATKSASEDDG